MKRLSRIKVIYKLIYMPVIHTFSQSNAKGKIGESVITQYFESLDYEVTKLSVKEQKEKLYDLECVREDNNPKQFQIEVKTELRAEDTGNIYYETIVGDKPGWCLKYSEDSKVIIMWYLPISNKVLCLPARKLKEIDYEAYPYKTVWNPRYTAGGYVVPLTYMYERCKIIDLGGTHEHIIQNN